jgi:hypothetical protein
MALPNIQNAQYGDASAIQKLGPVRRTANPAADVNGMKNNVGGRPAEKDLIQMALKGAQQQQAAQPSDEERYSPMFNSLAIQYKTALKWVRLASLPDAGPVTKEYAKGVLAAFARSLSQVRNSTPFFDET